MESKGIATRFKGVNFRSRLEARWAHVFEKLGWDWAYEPFDLDGWIPDFLIRCGGERDLLIDIKPLATFTMDRAPIEIMEKLDRADRGQHFLAILGVEPCRENYTIGWLRNCEFWDVAGFCSSYRNYNTTREETDDIGLCQDIMSYHDVISGEHSKRILGRAHEERVKAAFLDALNLVQWNRKSPTHIVDVIASTGLR